MPSSKATLATRIAAKVANADIMPSAEDLPKISFIDAFLPRSVLSVASAASKKDSDGKVWSDKPTNPNVGRKVQVTYYDIKKKNGSKIIEKHKSPAASAHGNNKKDDAAEAKKGEEGGKKGQKKNGDDKKEEVKKDEKAGGDDKPTEQEWTAEEDAKLRELKESNTSWAKIGEQLGGRPKWQLTARWKEIQGKPVEGAVASGGDDKKDEKKEKEEPKKDHQQQNEGKKGKKGKKNKGGGNDTTETTNDHPAAADNTNKNDKTRKNQPPAPTKTPSKPPSKAPSTRSRNRGEEARFTMNEWLTLQEDDLFSFGELQCLSELIMRDSNMTWLRIAAAFYDKTGRRVHPDDIRDKFEQMAGMGG